MIMNFKMLKQLLMVGILIGLQGCGSATLGQFFAKPYFASPPAQMTQEDRELFEHALFLQKNNRIQPVIKVWNQFLEKHPRSFEAHNNLGLVYFEDDQIDASIAELETAMSLEPNESKIIKNLVRVLKFKAILYKEAKEFNRAVDTLKRSQEIASLEQKEKIGYRIEEYEDKTYEQAESIGTLEAYEGFLKRYPNSSKNSDEARMKIEGLKSSNTAFQNKKMFPVNTDELEAPPAEAPLTNAGNEGMDAGNPVLEDSPAGERSKENMAEATPVVEDFTEKKIEKVEINEETLLDVENLDERFIPVQPLKAPRSVVQKPEIATQVEPGPVTGVDQFPSLEPDVSPPEPDNSSHNPQTLSQTQEDFPEVAEAPQRRVRVITRISPLRVREDPYLNSRILATVPKGSLIPLIKEENGWYKVEFSTGQMGWISKKYSQLVE